MFAVKFSCIAALAFAPWAQAILLQIPVDWQSSSPANISWSHTASDVPFTLQLANTDEFHDTFSIANNVNPTADFDTFTLPVVPQGTYTLRAINVTNVGQIFDETPGFTIQGPPESSSQSSAASTSASASVSSNASGSTTLTVPVSTGTRTSSSTGFGVTVSNTGSPSNAAAAGTSSGSGSAASTASSFNNGAASLPNLAPWAIAALGVLAGAAAAL